MKKKILGFVMAAVVGMMMFAGCGAKQEAAPAAEKTSASTAEKSSAPAAEKKEDTSTASEELTGKGKSITALFFSLEGEYFTLLDDMLRAGLEPKGYTYESQSSNFDPVTQIEQIENAVAKGTTAIWIWAVDGRPVHDALKAAKEKGVFIYSFVQNPGEDAAHIVRGTDETICGTTLAEMAIQWADKEKPKAKDGEIKVLFLANENSENQKTRCDTCQEVLFKDPRFKLVERYVGDGTTVGAQNATENLFAKYNGDIDLVVSSGGEDALGVAAYLASESCVAPDPIAVGNVSVEINEELAAYMRTGLYDAAAVNGGNIVNNIATQVDELDKLINGKIGEGFSAVEIGRVTIDNLEEYGY